ncbi:MAG: PilZ domain-containing protein [Acidobacteriales bacterium]|nr:PilZ domain-containing protein [Terriglobales bacterium]
MERILGSAISRLTLSKKNPARAALVDIKGPAQNVLMDCFRQFGVETVIMNGNAAERLRTEKFAACVVNLGPEAHAVMEAVRTSPSNSRMVIYGVGGTMNDGIKYSKYGINAVFDEPLERPAALKLVRATQMLVLHEFRRYIRIPVITEVAVITGDNRRFTATSQEISSGGMSLTSKEDVSAGMPLEISFALLTLPRVWIRGVICWRKSASKSFGVRFDVQDERRLRIKEWIDAYLEN